jgi:hypothetical protein
MLSITSLWLPIVLAAGLVFIASSIIHMGPFWHRRDYQAVPGEAQLMDALRPLAIPPGEYMIPCATHQQMSSPELQEKLRRGPVAILSMMPNGPITMGRPLALWFAYLLLVALLTALLTVHVLPPGIPYPRVFKVVLLISFMGYGLALLQNSIWLRRPWPVTLKGCFDALIYAGLTAGTFGWLWPHAAP